MNVHFTLPTIREASALYNLLLHQPNWEWDIENSMLNKYALVPLEVEWLQKDAPAGLISSICKTLLACGHPNNPDEIGMLLNVTRGSQNLYDQFKQLLIEAELDVNYLQSIDFMQLMSLSIASEPKLIRKGVLERGFEIVSKEKKKPVPKPQAIASDFSTPMPTPTPSKKQSNSMPTRNPHIIAYGVIDTKAANADMRRQGIID